MTLMRKLTLIAATNNFVVQARHLMGKDNNIADAISRFQTNKFRALAPHAERNPTRCIPCETFLTI